MPGLHRVALLSILCLSSGPGCGQGHDDAQPGASGGAASATGGRAAADAGSTSGSAGARIVSNAGNAAAGSASQAGAASAGGTASNAGAPGDGGEATATPEAIDLPTIMDTYRSFTPQAADPVSVSGYIFGLCRLPTLPEEEFAASIHGEGRYLLDWANERAAQGIADRGQPPFSPGAVIVKEKYAGPHAAEADLVALGIMIKRGPGFAPEHGDWDYAYYEPALGMVQSAEQSEYCAGCHAGAAATDFVYVDGLKP